MKLIVNGRKGRKINQIKQMLKDCFENKSF